MKIIFTEEGWEDYLFWQTQDKKILKKINTLIQDVAREPFGGLGKPEPLKYDFAGYWSRRITTEHRLIYEIYEDSIIIVACRYHH